MSAGGYLDACGFNPVSNGTGNFVVSAAITGYQTPASAGAVNGTVYSYRAESADKSQWEEGFGAYTVSGTTLARSTITANSSGGSTAINFTSAPNVYITALSADLANASLLIAGTLPDARLSNTIAAGGPTGSATVIPVITYDAHGRLTAVTTANITVPKQADQQVFTSTGAQTWTKPSGFGAKAYAFVQCWGAGCGGVKTATQVFGGGGGGYKEGWFALSSLGSTETATVGAGGAASTSSTVNPGGNTTFGAWVTAYGGGKTGAVSNGGSNFAQGGYTGYTDSTGGAVTNGTSWEGGMGGSTTTGTGLGVWGGGGGGGVQSGTAATGAASQFGGAGGNGSSAGTATAGSQPGGGGGSTLTGTAAKGGDGKIIVTVFDGA